MLQFPHSLSRKDQAEPGPAGLSTFPIIPNPGRSLSLLAAALEEKPQASDGANRPAGSYNVNYLQCKL